MNPTMLLMTVHHTGTQYFHQGLKDDYNVTFRHCLSDHLKEITNPRYDCIATTYRDPLLVGASWANREKIGGRRWDNFWFAMWGMYAYLLSTPDVKVFYLGGNNTQHGVTFDGQVVGSIDDVYLMHKAIEENDMDSYYEYCPRSYIDYANYCSMRAHG